MNALDEILQDDNRARLIPTVADSNKELRLVSILLATLSVVPALSKSLLGQCGAKIGKRSKLNCYTEVAFESLTKDGKDRPDGVIVVTSGKYRWTALLEAKVGNNEIDVKQVERYAKVAQKYRVDSVITLSNQLVPLPSHLPYKISKPPKNVSFFHISWLNVLTQTHLILLNDEDLIREQEFILYEMSHYFNPHNKTGVRHFDQMNSEWKELVAGFRHDKQYSPKSLEIQNTVASWFQEERDISLLLSRRIHQKIDIKISREHRNSPESRFNAARNLLVSKQELRSVFSVPNAASAIEVKANLNSRTISCSMSVSAPENKAKSISRINWIVNQFRNIDDQDVGIRAYWPGRARQSQKTLAEIRKNPECLINEQSSGVLTKFEVFMVRDIANKFSGPQSFIKELENLVPVFYKRIGEKLKAPTPRAHTIDKDDPIRNTKSAEKKVVDTDT